MEARNTEGLTDFEVGHDAAHADAVGARVEVAGDCELPQDQPGHDGAKDRRGPPHGVRSAESCGSRRWGPALVGMTLRGVHPRGRRGGYLWRGCAHWRRRPRMLSKNDEKKIWIPTITSVAATTAMCSSASEPNPCEIHVATITAPSARPTSTKAPPSSRPCSRRKRARMRSNQGSRSPMK